MDIKIGKVTDEFEVVVEDDKARVFFATQNHLMTAYNVDGQFSTTSTSVRKYAAVIFDKVNKRFIKHRIAGYPAANEILKQAGY